MLINSLSVKSGVLLNANVHSGTSYRHTGYKNIPVIGTPDIRTYRL